MTAASITYGNANGRRDSAGRWLAQGEFAETRKLLESTLKRAVKQDRADRLRAACERILDIAANDPEPRNAMMAFSIIADRLDGKAVARIETSSDDVRGATLADLVALVMQSRKADAVDGVSHDAPGTLAVPAPSDAPSQIDTPGGTGI